MRITRTPSPSRGWVFKDGDGNVLRVSRHPYQVAVTGVYLGEPVAFSFHKTIVAAEANLDQAIKRAAGMTQRRVTLTLTVIEEKPDA